MLFRAFKSRLDQIDLMPGCRDSLLRFLLERVQHADGVLESDCVDRAIRFASVVIHNFQHTPTAEPLECLGRGVFAALLRPVKRVAHDLPYFGGEGSNIVTGRTHPLHRFERCHQTIIDIWL